MTTSESWVSTPEPSRPFTWPDRAAVEVCLTELANGGLFPSSNTRLVAVMASEELRRALHDLGSWPVLKVHCRRSHCQARLERWVLAPSDGIAGTYFVPNREQDRNSAPVPATARAVAGKGNRLKQTSSHDAKGAYSLCCPDCGEVTPLSPELRTKLYLEAVRDHQTTIYVQSATVRWMAQGMHLVNELSVPRTVR